MHAYVLRNSHERIYLYSYMGYSNSFYMLLGVLVFSYINAERKRVDLRSIFLNMLKLFTGHYLKALNIY